MAYTVEDFRSKKAMKEALAAGKVVAVYQPGPFGEDGVKDGRCAIEGPHYPKPHTWYADVLVKDGAIVKVVS